MPGHGSSVRMRLRKEGTALDYRCAKQHSEPGSDKRGVRLDELHLTPPELIVRVAALVPPPRTHRHRFFGVPAPNSPLRAAVTALAQPAQPAKQVVVQAEPANMSEGALGVVTLGRASPPTPEPAPPKRSPAYYLWAVLIARIYEVFPLLYPPAALYCRPPFSLAWPKRSNRWRISRSKPLAPPRNCAN